MKSVCVYCGSSTGENPEYRSRAAELGGVLESQGIALVYGGGSVGLMGILADSVMTIGGEVIGVIPRFLKEKEVGHDKLTQLILVESMHERKSKMSELADGFIAMPGGFGTLEELAEILTWVQLGLIRKPVGVLNVDYFFDNLILQLDKMVEQGFLRQQNRDILLVDSNPQSLVARMQDYLPIQVEKWIDTSQT